jgi:hypothetical protein
MDDHKKCRRLDIRYVGFEISTAVVMKSVIFWDMTPCSPLSCTRRFGGTYRLHLQGASQRTTRRRIPKDDTLDIR